MNGWMDRDGWMWMHGWMDGWMDEWMDGWTSGWIDRDGWMDEWMDRWMDGEIINTASILLACLLVDYFGIHFIIFCCIG